jgi:hypothetical protein
MNAKARASSSTHEMQFELKYCERCGGLWLRPVGGGQIYCGVCAQAMGELPPASSKWDGGESARMPLGPRWAGDSDDADSYEDYDELGFDAAGGVA